MYALNDPVNKIDPTGLAPVYDPRTFFDEVDNFYTTGENIIHTDKNEVLISKGSKVQVMSEKQYRASGKGEKLKQRGIA